jgi:phage replication-related protein YjqB (UPF0714/DUF867 family)
MNRHSDSYMGYADLANAQTEGTDYTVDVRPVASSPVAVIAPHGGRIERSTSDIARALAGEDFNLYLFEGIRPADNYAALHLTSHRFDEPRCLSLLSKCDHVIAVHGCGGHDQRVLLGGLDGPLKHAIAQTLTAVGVTVTYDGHPFPATDPNNVCNRGRSGVGVQLEMTMGFRQHGPRNAVCAAIRSVLLALPEQRQQGGTDQ